METMVVLDDRRRTADNMGSAIWQLICSKFNIMNSNEF